MATYQELKTLVTDSALQDKVEAAVTITAHDLAVGTPTADDQAWVAKALNDTRGEAKKALKFVLAASKDNTVAQIQGATDAAIQTNVDVVRPVLVEAYKAERV